MADGLKISELSAVNPQDTDEIPVRRSDTNKKYLYSTLKAYILTAVNALLYNYSSSSHTHTGVYEPADADIQTHLEDTDIHVTTVNKAAWDAKNSKILKVAIGTKTTGFNVSLAVDSVQTVTIGGDLTIGVEAMPLGNGTETLLIITASGNRTIAWDAGIPDSAFVNGKLTSILDGVKYHVYINTYDNTKDTMTVFCPANVAAASIHEYTFDNDDLSSYVLTYTHNLNTDLLIIQLYDPNGIRMDMTGILTLTSVNELTIDFGGPLAAGTYRLVYLYG